MNGKETFLDMVIRDAKRRGEGKIHEPLNNWGKFAANQYIQGHTHKDEFRKAPRRTIGE